MKTIVGNRSKKERAANIAMRTESAYSFDRYANWTAVAKALTDLGLKDVECEAIMFSKWMRWAADSDISRYGRVPARAIVRYIALSENYESIKKLTAGHIGSSK
jgi:hypothetical protein